MSVALTIQTNDGLVIATDSAATVFERGPDGNSVPINVYDNANKVFHLHKGLPVGLAMCGALAIGNSSMATLIKDFRREITLGPNPVNADSYSIEEIAQRFYDFIYVNKYVPEMATAAEKPIVWFVIGGYSAGANHAEQWSIWIDDQGQSTGPQLLKGRGDSGICWHGQTESLYRILLGYSPHTFEVMKKVGVEDVKQIAFQVLAQHELTASLVGPSTPIRDAIDLAEYLVNVAIGYVRYSPGPNSVGGPIEIAAITKHEGFTWIQRKLYYNSAFNGGGAYNGGSKG